jgi:hypothetical protein
LADIPATTLPTSPPALADVRGGIVGALRLEDSDLDEYCHAVEGVDVCGPRARAEVQQATDTCALLADLPGAQEIELLPIAAPFEPVCGAVGEWQGACYVVKVLARKDESNGSVVVIVVDPEHWDALNTTLADLDADCRAAN